MELITIENTLKSDISNKIVRVNYPFETNQELEEEVYSHDNDAVYYKYTIEPLNCNKCRADTYLMKDKNKFVWVCFKCGNKFDADIEDAKKLMLWEI